MGDRWILFLLVFSLLFFAGALYYRHSSLFAIIQSPDMGSLMKSPDSLSLIAALPQKPVSKLATPSESGMPLLVVSKCTKRIFVFKKKGREWEKIADFPVIFGENEGNKRILGDNKTPEGNYWIMDAIPGVWQGRKYGALVLPLNYPNAEDRRKGKSGSGIWIHGSQFGRGLEPTRGCIKLENRDILSLYRFVEPPVPVVILPKNKSELVFDELELDWIKKELPAISVLVGQNRVLLKDNLSRLDIVRLVEGYISREDSLFGGMDSRSGTVLRRLAQWKNAWSKKDLPFFSSVYHSSFRDWHGRNKEAFLERKSRIFQQQDSIRVSLDSIAITCPTDSMALVTFKQDYRSYTHGVAVYTNTMVKQFNLKKISNNWYITKEEVPK